MFRFLLIGILVISVSLTTGCNKQNQFVMKMEEPIDINMPEEEGIFIDKIGEGSLILVRLNMDYGFKKYLEKGSLSLEEHITYLKENGIDFYDKALDLQMPFCTTYSAKKDTGESIFGRNEDLFPDDTVLLMYTQPSDGYASVSMTDAEYFGYIDENTDLDEIERFMKAAAHFPADGMNECGVVIAQNLVPAAAGYDPQKISIGSTAAVRLVLDYAKNVDEAIKLLEKYNIYFEFEQQGHYLIADTSGESVIVEFVNGEMKIIKNELPWQVNSNFALSNYPSEEDAYNGNGCLRYKTAYKFLKERDGVLKNQEPFELLKDVIQDNTLYSTVYNQTSGEIQIAMHRKFSTIYQFNMDMK